MKFKEYVTVVNTLRVGWNFKNTNCEEKKAMKEETT